MRGKKRKEWEHRLAIETTPVKSESDLLNEDKFVVAHTSQLNNQPRDHQIPQVEEESFYQETIEELSHSTLAAVQSVEVKQEICSCPETSFQVKEEIKLENTEEVSFKQEYPSSPATDNLKASLEIQQSQLDNLSEKLNMREIEINARENELHCLRDELTKVQERLELKENDLKKKSEAFIALVQKAAEKEQRFSSEAATASKLRHKLSNEDDDGDLRADSTDQEEINKLKQEVLDREASLTEKETELQAKEKEVIDLRERLERKSFDETETNNLRSELEAKHQQLELRIEECTKLQDKFNTQTGLIEQLQTFIRELEEDIGHYKDRLSENETELDKSRAENQSLQERLESGENDDTDKLRLNNSLSVQSPIDDQSEVCNEELKEKIKMLEEKLQQSEDLVRKLNVERETADQDIIDQRETDSSDGNGEASISPLQHPEMVLSTTDENVDVTNKEVSEIKTQEQAELRNELDEMKKNLDQKSAELQRLEEEFKMKLEGLENEVLKLTVEKEELEVKISHLEKTRHLENEVSEKITPPDTPSKHANLLYSEIEKLQSCIQEIEKDKRLLTGEKHSYELQI